MKKILTPVFMILFFSAAAQMTQDDVNLIQSMYGKDKRDLIQSNLHFKDSSSAVSFWKLYDSYEAERKKLGQDYINILQDYAKNYESLDDKKTDELVLRSSNNNIAFENLYLKYYNKMKPVVGSITAGEFVQAEAYLRMSVRIQILDQIPFIGDIERSRKPVTN